jgi:AcrR family transcriptional regulator
MGANEPVAGADPNEAPATGREQAMARVLSPARARAETRLQSFFDAALELMQSSSGTDFTVQELVERSGQSLRSFYQYFDGKYAFLLALFEDSLRSTTEELKELVAEEDDPFERLHRFAVEYYRLCQANPKGRPGRKGSPRALADFSLQLLTDHPQEATKAFQPLITLFERLLDEASAAGYVRPGLSHSRIAGVVLQAVMFNAFATTISGSSAKSNRTDPAEELWDLLLHGIATP